MDSVPRVRVSRQQPRARLGVHNIFDTPQAGPSRISTQMDTLDVPHSGYDDDDQATPKVPVKPQPGFDVDMLAPELRLRSAMSQLPNLSATPVYRKPRSPTLSDMESDFEPPNMTTNATDASVAKESVKELFSAVLQDTPQKSRTRRNSIDASEVEASPRIERVQRERAKNKGKRKSMSDEEAEKVSTAADLVASEASFRSSTAMSYANLRQRLADTMAAKSRIAKFDDASYLSGSEVDMDGPVDRSGDTATALKQFEEESASFAPPVDATSTPMRSLQLPSELQMQSNLMEQDSEMQKVMQGMDTLDGDSIVNKTRKSYPFPGSRPGAPSRAESSGHSHSHANSAHSKSHSLHNLPLGRRVSIDSASSRNSSLSAADFKEIDQYERERAWNKPLPKSPGHNGTPEPHRHHSSGSPSQSGYSMPGSARSRRSSSASMHSFDDRFSMAGSSTGSRADLNDRMKEIEDDKIRERERMWNHPRAKLSRSTSSLSFNSPGERQRTSSFPSRPDSAQSFNTPSRRPNSWHSIPTDSSRPGSSASSIASYTKEPRSEPRNPVVRERERNWNSNHPAWEFQQPPRSMSPLPRSPSAASHTHRHLSNASGSPSNVHMDVSTGSRRDRTVSLGNQSQGPRSPPEPPLVRKSEKYKLQVSQSPRARRTPEDPENGAPYGSRFGWSFPKNHNHLPPLELDDSAREHMPSPPGSRPSSRLSAPRPSQIPVRSPRKGDFLTTVPKRPSSPSPCVDPERKLGHRRSAAEIDGAISSYTPRIMIEPVDLMHAEDLVATDIESDSAESDLESQVTSTPLARPFTIPEEAEHAEVAEAYAPVSPSPPSTPPALPAALPEDPRLENPISAKPSTPSSSPRRRTGPTSPLLGLQTPPRRPQFSTSKVEFQTPSPPHNMPDLPGPPSSSEDENNVERTPSKSDGFFNGNLTAIKTPRPPGAWAMTPAPIEKPDVQPMESTPPAPNFKEAQETLPGNAPATASKTPAPPGAWQATPSLDSLRRKGILKVRFDVESNASGDTTLDEVPVVGPSAKSGDSISEIFPSVPTESIPDNNQKSKTQSAKAAGKENSIVPNEPPSTPSTTRIRPKSPGVRVLDAFGRETTDVASPASEASSSQLQTDAEKGKAKESSGPSSPRSKSAVRIVDAMGREVAESDISAAEDSVELPEPRSRKEALRRLRQAVSGMACDLSDSDDSRAASIKNDERLNELYRTSQAARSTRQGLSESIQKHKDTEAELRAKYGSLRESMQRTKLLPPAITERSSRLSINFLNTWVLWAFLFLQIVLLVYMYRFSTIRAKRIFLTTYYDAFEPALFAHIPKSDSLQRATPSPSSVSSPFSVSDALVRSGWKGLLKETWSHVTATAVDWQMQLWDAWRRDARTTAWPPT
ncbi:hypothetical protein BC835DRAFT_1338951 [Cytidiella melzeri]|nr:hypothetical protein BC835DRAFT_1338951 [Cytidiella melzeri]